MTSLFPILISATLSLGLILIVVALTRGRGDGDAWARMEGKAPTTDAQDSSRERSSPVGDFVNKRLQDSSYADKIARRLIQADVRLTAAEFIASQIGAAAIGAVVGIPLGSRLALPTLIGVGLGAVVGYLVPGLVVKRKRSKRVAAFNAQLSDSIMMLANSLRAGYSLLQSMDLLSRDAPHPTGIEYRRVVQEVGIGLSLTEALNNLLRRVPSDDLDLMITAITVQQEVGGNLSQVLEGISDTIRERVRIKGEIRVLTSQGRYSGYVITALPLGIALIISFINPGYMTPLWSFPWVIMPIVSLLFMGMAYLIIRKIVNIEV